MALRVYTTRLLGGDPKLVLHGGGNTSVKTTMQDMIGDTVDVICVKGSGWDMGNIEPPGLPAMSLAALRRLRKLDKLSDEDMVNFQRINLLDAAAPNPSVETLLHAFLPHKFVDHSHSSAVVSITDQPDGERSRSKLSARTWPTCRITFRASRCRKGWPRRTRRTRRCRASFCCAMASSLSATMRARPMS